VLSPLNPRLYEKTHQLKEVQVTEFKKQTNQMQTIDAKASKLTPDAAGGSIESVPYHYGWRQFQE
jgi:hypothetical protein